MRSCFGYIRVSTQKQGEGVSLQAQKDAIAIFAQRNNLKVIDWFEEKETAAKSGRPVFNRMLKLLRQGKASGLIMHKIDRSARNLRDWAIISELPDNGIDIYIATESYDFNSRGGRLTADIQAVIAADYIRNLREETIKGLNGRLKQGLYPFRAPIGYLDNGKGQPKTICPIKGPLVREAFETYARGEHSLRALIAHMAKRGLRNSASKPLSLCGIETMLRNPFYTGLIEIRRTGATYQGIHKPIIDAATFRWVQEVRAGRAGKKVTRHNHLYRGLFRCGMCNSPMSPELQKGCVYYRCHRSACKTRTVREERLDLAVRESLEALSFTDRDARNLTSAWHEWSNSDGGRQALAALELRIAKTNERLDRLTDLLVDGTIDKSDYERRKQTLKLELAELEQRRAKATRRDLSDGEMAIFIELMKSLVQLHNSAVPAEKRAMLRNLYSNRTVSGKSVELEPHIWLTDRKFDDLSSLVPHADTLIELFRPDHANDNRQGDAMCDFR